MADEYDTDILTWSEQQAALLRRMAKGERVNDQVDWENVAEEIESVGISQKREVRSRLAVLCQHLLKWAFQPELQSRSWRATILVQRQELFAVIKDSPSLRPFAAQVLADAFDAGRQRAENETGLLNLPDACPWSVEAIMSADFWPEAG